MKRFFCAIVIIINLSCSSSFQTIGKYVSTTSPYEELLFEKERFVFRYNNAGNGLALFYCSDTIAYGKWSKIKNQPLIELMSDDSQLLSLSAIEVKEKKSDDPQKFSFTIKNPIEFHQEKINNDARIVRYGIEIRSTCIEFQGNLANQRFDSNEFSFSIPKDCNVSSFSIYVYPVDFQQGWRDQHPVVIRSSLYEIKNQESNVFEVNLHGLTYCYMNAKRLNHDYVVVENENLLKWDGCYYKRSNK